MKGKLGMEVEECGVQWRRKTVKMQSDRHGSLVALHVVMFMRAGFATDFLEPIFLQLFFS